MSVNKGGNDEIMIDIFGCNNDGKFCRYKYPAILNDRAHLVKVLYSSVDFNDISVKKGRYDYKNYNRRLFGFEGVGQVIQIGSHTSLGIKVNDIVAFCANSNPFGIGKTCLIHEDIMYKITESTLEEDSKIYFPTEYYRYLRKGITVKNLLVDIVKVGMGRTIVVSNPCCASASLLCRALLHIGVKVIGIVPDKSHIKHAKNIGLKHVLTYKSDDLENYLLKVHPNKRRASIVYDFFGGDFIKEGIKLIDPCGFFINVEDRLGELKGEYIDVDYIHKMSLSFIRYNFNIYNYDREMFFKSIDEFKKLINETKLPPIVSNIDESRYEKCLDVVEKNNDYNFFSIKFN